jgi:hypothetical protein
MSVPNLFNARPIDGVKSTGIFTPNQNVTKFNVQSGVSDPPFNVILAVRDQNNNLLEDGPRNLVGSATTPYVPSALPVYIPTLYASVYEIQSGLVNGPLESELTEDNRKYPTVKAVKNYVASQLAGSEIVTAKINEDDTTVKKISTNLVTTILNKIADYDYYAADIISPNGPNINIITNLNGDAPDDRVILYNFPLNQIDESRNGSVKRIVNASILLNDFTLENGIAASEAICVSLYPDPNPSVSGITKRVFIANGKEYKSYYFSHIGDFLEMVQVIQIVNETTTPIQKAEIFFVTNYGGTFGEEAIELPNP